MLNCEVIINLRVSFFNKVIKIVFVPIFVLDGLAFRE